MNTRNGIASVAVVLLTAAATLAAEDAWTKVRGLKPGTEVRIYSAGGKEPLAAKLDRAGDDSVVVITKNGQVSVSKEEIDRLDARTSDARSLMKHPRANRKIERKGAETTRATLPGGTTSVSTGLNLPKAGFERVYERERPPAAK